MQRNMLRSALYSALLMGLTAVLAGCGGGSGSTTTTSPMSGSMPLTISDASSDDWATIGVKVLSIALVPQGGGSAVTVWSAPMSAPYVNLEQLDQLGELLLCQVMREAHRTASRVPNRCANPSSLLATRPETSMKIRSVKSLLVRRSRRASTRSNRSAISGRSLIQAPGGI